MKNRKRTILAIIAILLIVMLLFILKSCDKVSDKHGDEHTNIDTNIYENLNKDEKKIIDETKKPVLIHSIDEYKDFIKPLDKLSDTVFNNVIKEIIKEGNSVTNKDTNSDSKEDVEPFQCDEDTAKIYEAYSRMFKLLSESYANISFNDQESYGEIEYLISKSDYYSEISQVLENLSSDMRENKVEEVLKGFDTMGSILENLKDLGGYVDESL